MKSNATTSVSPTIPFVNIDDLDLESRSLIERAASMGGFTPHSMLTHFHRPDIAKTVFQLMMTVFLSPNSSLPNSLKHKLSVICTTVNGCVYCTSHQCMAAQIRRGATGLPAQNIEGAALSEEEILKLASGEDQGKDSLERACFAFARAASYDPHSVSEQMLDDLKKTLSTPQIVELAFVVSAWKLANTLHDILHIPVEAVVPDGAAVVAHARKAVSTNS
jgi:alkylhydroperoxidase family enzyme